MLFRCACSLFAASLFANPQGPSIIAGQASFSETSRELSVSTRGRTIIDWDSFSIESGELTRFLQDAPVLNRVIGADPSRLMGMLEANGEIYLLNPQGVLVGRDAVIQTGGFIASTLNVDNGNFLAGAKVEFFGNSLASVVFEGTHNLVEEGGGFFSSRTTSLK
jgi:filamentous hemagglutinin family protein